MAAGDVVVSTTEICELVDGTRRRLVPMLAAVPDASVRAIGGWSIGETAAHLRTVTAIDAFVAAGIKAPDHLQPVVDRSTRVSLSEVADMNALTLECEPERDTRTLAARIDEGIDAILDAAPSIDWSRKVHWLGGLTATPTGVLGHLLAETLIHGRDIARAAHLSFPMSPDAARAFFETFLIDVLDSPEIGEFGEQRGSSAEGLSWEVRLRGSTPVAFEVRQGAIQAREAGGRDVDVRISADPTAMLLLTFNRVSPVRAALSGKVRLSGRRPWRARRLMSLMTMP
jgi:SCP-2 sterol transfer family